MSRGLFWILYPSAALGIAILWSVLVGSWNLGVAATFLLSVPVGAILTLLGFALYASVVES